MIDYLSQTPWPWYWAGLLITSVMVTLMLLGRKFGVSSTMRTVCSVAGGGRCSSFFDFKWKDESWNLLFILGAVIGGVISKVFLDSGQPLSIAPETVQELEALGVSVGNELIPTQIFSWEGLFTWPGFIMMVVGGFFVGFGARYAGGCTSGHGISGLAHLQLPSLIAVIGFFIGGLLVTHLLLPIILTL